MRRFNNYEEYLIKIYNMLCGRYDHKVLDIVSYTSYNTIYNPIGIYNFNQQYSNRIYDRFGVISEFIDRGLKHKSSVENFLTSPTFDGMECDYYYTRNYPSIVFNEFPPQKEYVLRSLKAINCILHRCAQRNNLVGITINDFLNSREFSVANQLVNEFKNSLKPDNYLPPLEIYNGVLTLEAKKDKLIGDYISMLRYQHHDEIISEFDLFYIEYNRAEKYRKEYNKFHSNQWKVSQK